MQSNGSRFGAVKEISRNGILLARSSSQGVGLSNNAFREAFGNEAAIGFLDDLKHQIADWNWIHSSLD
jgi:hypothetical protein